MAAPITWSEAVEQLLASVPWAQEEWGEKWTGAISLYHDLAAFGSGEAVLSSWLLEPSSPDDALPLIGANRNMERYPYETNAQYRARLAGAWDAWQLAGTRQVLIDQFAAIGLTIEIYSDAEWPRPPTPWWSKFTILITAGGSFGAPIHFGDDGALFGDSTTSGSGGSLFNDGTTFGDGTVFGISSWSGGHLFGISGDPNLVAAAKGIVRKWKAAHEVCWEIVTTASANLFGQDGLLFGDPITFGGEEAKFSAV